MKIQVTVAGYGGQPMTMLFYFDENTGVLMVVKSIKYTEDRTTNKDGERIEGMALATNLDLKDYDFRFLEKHLAEAIRSYFTRKGQSLLDIAAELRMHDPEAKIEMDGVDEGGRRYRIKDDIGNGQMAILMAVAFIDHQRPIQSMIDVANEMAEFYSITSI